jgi:putative ABC transport system permease protein
VPLRLILAHFRASKLRTSLTVGSVALALFLFCTLQTVLTSLDALISGVGGNRLIASSAVSLFQLLPLSTVEKIRAARIDGIGGVGHWTWFDGVFRGDPSEFFARFAVDATAFRDQYGDRSERRAEYRLSAEDWDRFERGKATCIVGRGLAARYGLRVGDPLALEGTIFPGDWRFTIAAIYASDNPTYDEETMFFHWSYLNEGMRRPDVVGILSIDIRDEARIAAQVDALFANSGHRTLTQPEAAFQAQFLSMWGNVGLLFSFIGGAVIFASFMITLNTMLLAVAERVKEIGVLKTLGFGNVTLRALYLVEATLLCGGGALLGAGLARLLWHGQPLHLATVVFPEFVVTDGTLLTAAGIGLGLALVSGIAPAIVASRTTIVRALRSG